MAAPTAWATVATTMTNASEASRRVRGGEPRSASAMSGTNTTPSTMPSASPPHDVTRRTNPIR